MNRFFSSKGRNTANAREQIKGGKVPATKSSQPIVPEPEPASPQYFIMDEAQKTDVSNITLSATDLAGANSLNFSSPVDSGEDGEDLVYTFAVGDFSYEDVDGHALDKIRLQAVTASSLWVGADASEGGASYASFAHAGTGVTTVSGVTSDTGTYSLKIPFPKGGQTFDFSYPGDDPVVSLRIRDLESRNRNYTSVILIALLGLVLSASRIFVRKPEK